MFFGRLTRQVQEPFTKNSQTASVPFTGTRKLASSQTAHLILCSPHKTLTGISKENVRLFCSRSVICHAKRLSCSSGDVSCRLCHTDLLSAHFSFAINTAVSGTVYPSLSSLFIHTFAIFQFLLRAAKEHLSFTQTQVLVISTWILHSASCIRLFCVVISNIFSERNNFSRRFVDV